MDPDMFSKPTRRFLAIALPALVLLVLIFGVLMPVLSFEAGIAAQTAQQRETLRRYRAAGASLGDLKAAVEEAKAKGTTGTVAVAPSVALASARLQTDLRGHVAARSGKTTSIEALEAETAGPLTRAGIRVQGTLPAGEFPKLLHAIETDPARLIIGDLTVASRSAQLGRSANRNQGSDELVFMLTAYRFYEIGEGS